MRGSADTPHISLPAQTPLISFFTRHAPFNRVSLPCHTPLSFFAGLVAPSNLFLRLEALQGPDLHVFGKCFGARHGQVPECGGTLHFWQRRVHEEDDRGHEQAPPPPPPTQIGGRIRPTSPICSSDLLCFWIVPICSANFQTAGTHITDRLNTYGSPWSALRDNTYTRECSPVVCKLVYPHSVFELNAVPILAWSGVGCLDFCMCCVLSQFIVQPGGGGGTPLSTS